MNDTSNAKPLLILTVVTLFVAVFVLGVVMWQTFLLDEQSRSLEERITNARKLPAPIARPDASDDKKMDGPQVVIHEDPVIRTSADGETTYLNDNSLALRSEFDTSCQSFASIGGADVSEPVNADIVIDNENVSNFIGERFGEEADEFTSAVRGSAPAEDELHLFCDFEEDVWITRVRNRSDVSFFRWIDTDDSPYLDPYEPTVNSVNASYTFFPVENEFFLSTGYGDAGFAWWSYYRLDEASKHFDLIESCQGNIITDPETGAPGEDFEFTCSREYVK